VRPLLKCDGLSVVHFLESLGVGEELLYTFEGSVGVGDREECGGDYAEFVRQLVAEFTEPLIDHFTLGSVRCQIVLVLRADILQVDLDFPIRGVKFLKLNGTFYSKLFKSFER
jgi:hypothetical protein